MSQSIKAWISAARPRTLPLAAASISMGGFLAAFDGMFNWTVFFLTLLTTFLLQIMSNLANDYGDYQHGADHAGRVGPVRMVQSGSISVERMRGAIIVVGITTLLTGTWLLVSSVGVNSASFYIMLTLGLVSMAAAVNYTAGNKPYGYRGWGDLAVVVFFGLIAVSGTYFLLTSRFRWDILLPAFSCGLFATAVLNVNNIRDINSDVKAGKLSIPVRIGRKMAIKYHWVLLIAGLACSIIYVWLHYTSAWQWMFLLMLPMLCLNGRAVTKKSGQELDPYLKQMAITTLLYVLTFGIGMLVAGC